jgi:glycosyltransferase involved in cell wall biosynthesis
VPTTYVEPKGLFLLEALANGVPVVQPAHGAFPEIIERTGGGVLVQPGNPEALADGLLDLLVNRERAAALGRTGAEGVRAHYTLDHMAAAAEAVYEELRTRR